MRRIGLITLLVAMVLVGGCVERYISLKSEPTGATVWLNGEEVGTTAATTAFTWYGAYEVVLRKDGYETLRTVRRAEAPIYQWPVLDLFFETVWPGTLVDEHEWDFELQEYSPADHNRLINRALQLREQG